MDHLRIFSTATWHRRGLFLVLVAVGLMYAAVFSRDAVPLLLSGMLCGLLGVMLVTLNPLPVAIKPITPAQAKSQGPEIPDPIIEAVNAFLAERLGNGTSVTFTKDELYHRMDKTRLNLPKGIAFQPGWLNLAPLYSQWGWKVEYESPDRGESWASFFRFTATATL